ncbi:Preprotein translocase YajC [Syntrophomonas zehnderi OL-4]|uniref:Preprotein translocase YajC n=1 Tax=Syntrophomonas zehnderi OL-4 TaxID=690567 RepID=A0A0E4GER6_9FIRM|nr:preprotein translocase subunit YajC [Syntrophomonas zehnderi]CFX94528.1 Preprotein translocase YajC [Syntrophomonas zehnderi OL-4]
MFIAGTNTVASQQGWLTVAVYFGVFILIFYLFIILPRKKQDKKHDAVLESLKRGDKVVSIGGIRGEVSKVKDETIVVKVADNTEIEFVKKAISHKIED